MTEPVSKSNRRVSSQLRMVGLGEVLWDLLPSGRKLGGAPANFACHARQLGEAAAVVSCVGADKLGEAALQELAARGLDTSCVVRLSEKPTGTVEVSLDDRGQPSYTIVEDVAWDGIPWTSDLAALCAQTGVVCFGSLGQRSEASRQTIQRFVREMPEDGLRIFDLNLRPPFFDEQIVRESLKLCNILKLNDEELLTLAPMCNLAGDTETMLKQLVSQYNLRLVALTCGAEGAILADPSSIVRQAAYPTTVVDSIGAGDAFTATLAVGLCRGGDLPKIADAACRVAAYVCSQSGATPQLPAGLVPWLPSNDQAS